MGSPGTAPAPSGSGLQDNVAGMLAYITIVPAIIFLVLEPYNKNKFVRFHAFQNIFLCVGMMALGIGIMFLGFIPYVGLVTLFLGPILWLCCLVAWVICLVKAYGGQMWKIPVIGNFAEQQANK
jgi:uncharacterized membrane protein